MERGINTASANFVKTNLMSKLMQEAYSLFSPYFLFYFREYLYFLIAIENKK
jgi:hypothetical protein